MLGLEWWQVLWDVFEALAVEQAVVGTIVDNGVVDEDVRRLVAFLQGVVWGRLGLGLALEIGAEVEWRGQKVLIEAIWNVVGLWIGEKTVCLTESWIDGSLIRWGDDFDLPGVEFAGYEFLAKDIVFIQIRSKQVVLPHTNASELASKRWRILSGGDVFAGVLGAVPGNFQ